MQFAGLPETSNGLEMVVVQEPVVERNKLYCRGVLIFFWQVAIFICRLVELIVLT